MSLSLLRLSCTKIKEPTKSAQTEGVLNGFCSPPIPAAAVEMFRPTSLLRYAAALAGAVVATDAASVDADRDNGIRLQHLPPHRW